jgi:DNA-binding transcriptional MocR family regulator
MPRRIARFQWLMVILGEDCPLSSSARLTAAGLFTFMEREGTGACPSQHKLARITKLARSTVQLTLAELEREGFLLRREIGRGRGGFPRHGYEATIPDAANGPASGQKSAAPIGPIVGHGDDGDDRDWTDSRKRLDRSAVTNGPMVGHDPSLNPYQNPDSDRRGVGHDPRAEGAGRETRSPEMQAELRRVVQRLRQ